MSEQGTKNQVGKISKEEIAERMNRADGVVVPVILLKDLRLIATGSRREYTEGPFVNNKTAQWYADTIKQADAILAEGKA